MDRRVGDTAGGSPKAKRECEWDKISPKGRMSTRFERSQKFRKKAALKIAVAQLQIQMPLRLETPPPPKLIVPPTTFILLTHVPQLATETLLTPLFSPSPNWRILPCRPITYCSTAPAADSRVVKQDNKRPNSDGYNSRRRR